MAPSNPVRLVDAEGRPITSDNPLPTSATLEVDGGIEIDNVAISEVPTDPFGRNADAAATAGGTGTMQAKLRLVTSQLAALLSELQDKADLTDTQPVSVQSIAGPGAFVFGRATVATAGTRVPLVGSETVIVSGVSVKAHAGNDGTIFVGNDGVTSGNGFLLAPGEAFFFEFAGNLQSINIDAAQNGDGVSYFGS